MGKHVLVLNQDYSPINISTLRRAFTLVYLRKAEIVESHPEKVLRTPSRSYPWPTVIRLTRYVKVPYKNVPLTRLNIFRRDGFRCVYCGSLHDLTLDHVIPRSQGGRDTWENLVTACNRCNHRKGNRTPEQAGMKMLRRPYRPHYLVLWIQTLDGISDSWRPYLMLG